ncbi:hypothetical protein CBB_A0036 [Clostridium botulinum Bf]|nr:hypothetical protein CBB_A0036 [Clostridium botulinum Bf]
MMLNLFIVHRNIILPIGYILQNVSSIYYLLYVPKSIE